MPSSISKPGPLVILAIVLGGLLALTAPVGLVLALRGLVADRQRVIDELESLRSESDSLRQDALRRLEQEGSIPADTSGLDQLLAAMRRSAERMGSDEARATLNAAGAALNLLRPPLEAYAAALNRLEQSGGISVESLSSPRRIDERLALIDAFDQANSALADACAAIPSNFERLMLESGVPAQEASRAAAGMRESSQLPLLLAIRRTDTELCQATRGLLTMLRARWGRWEFDHASGMVMFHDDADVTAFGEWMTRLQQITGEQTRLQRQILGGS